MNKLYRYLICCGLFTLFVTPAVTAGQSSQQASLLGNHPPTLELLSRRNPAELPWQQVIFQRQLQPLLSDSGDGRHKLLVRGVNPNEDSLLVVIRLDDSHSVDYHSRVNIERLVDPGEFEWSFDLSALRCANGRLLDVAALKRVMLFYGQALTSYQQPVALKRVAMAPVVELVSRSGEQGIAYDFGPSSSALLDGAVALAATTTDTLVSLSGQLREVERPGPDPWLKDGIAGIDELTIDVTAAMRERSRFWQLTLFREDVGEWENLPRQLNLDIEVAGRVISWQQRQGSHNQTRKQQASDRAQQARHWYQQHYLKFYRNPAHQDPWQDIVARRGQPQSLTIDLEEVALRQSGTGQQLTIRLLGDSPAERFVAGLVFEPLLGLESQQNDADNTTGAATSNSAGRSHDDDASGSVTRLLDSVNALRQRYFKRHWHVQSQLPPAVTSVSDDNPLRVARDQTFVVQFYHHFDSPSQVSMTNPLPGFVMQLRYGQPGWYRDGSHFRLQRDIRHLTRVLPGQLVSGDVLVSALFYPDSEAATKPLATAQYTLQLMANGEPLMQHPLEVLDLNLAASGERQRPVGIYLDDNPVLNWFPELRRYGLAQTYCDLKFLAKTGIKALSPPLVTPTQNRAQDWQRQLTLYRRFYPEQSLLAYTPYKRLKQWLSGEALARQLARVSDHEYLYWSVADEVVLPKLSEVHADARLLHSANHTAKTAGQLNHPQQRDLIASLDLVIMNHGFGVDVDTVEDIQNQQKQVWLYNMPSMRHAAGLMLWRSQADGYIQWHGRMPTANPYDPTDGREADYQFFPPEPVPCGALPDIDRRLLDLLAGLNDQRWLLWLSAQSSEAAQALAQRIEQQAGDDWAAVAAVRPATLNRWNQQITDLARRLKLPHQDTAFAVQNAKPMGSDDDRNHSPLQRDDSQSGDTTAAASTVNLQPATGARGAMFGYPAAASDNADRPGGLRF